MTIRSHPITGEPIVFAPNRAERPGSGQQAADSEPCPFCPGNESQTPPTLAAIGDPWRARVFANKYPAIEGHEVIVESPLHDQTIADDVVRLYVDRVAAHRDAAYVALFKNHGAMAGATIPHPHSQLMPLPFVPPQIARERDAIAKRCALCNIAERAFAIAENETFRWLAPHGSTMAYQQWLVPKRHIASITELRVDEVRDLAMLLRSSSAAMLALAGAYNWSFNMPGHFYVDAFPRLTTIAGFELGTGTFIEIIDPAATARLMRHDSAS